MASSSAENKGSTVDPTAASLDEPPLATAIAVDGEGVEEAVGLVETVAVGEAEVDGGGDSDKDGVGVGESVPPLLLPNTPLPYPPPHQCRITPEIMPSAASVPACTFPPLGILEPAEPVPMKANTVIVIDSLVKRMVVTGCRAIDDLMSKGA